MIEGDRITRLDHADDVDGIPAGTLQLEPRVDPESAARLAELIDRMSDGRQSAAALDRMAALMAQLLVPDELVEDLVRSSLRV